MVRIDSMQTNLVQATESVLRARDLMADLPVFPLGPIDSFKLHQATVQDGLEILSWVGNFHNPISIDMLDDSGQFTRLLILGALACQLVQPGKLHRYCVPENCGGIVYTPDLQWNVTRQGPQEHIDVMIPPRQSGAMGY